MESKSICQIQCRDRGFFSFLAHIPQAISPLVFFLRVFFFSSPLLWEMQMCTSVHRSPVGGGREGRRRRQNTSLEEGASFSSSSFSSFLPPHLNYTTQPPWCTIAAVVHITYERVCGEGGGGRLFSYGALNLICEIKGESVVRASTVFFPLYRSCWSGCTVYTHTAREACANTAGTNARRGRTKKLLGTNAASPSY